MPKTQAPLLSAFPVLDDSGRLTGSVCPGCGKKMFPAVSICPDCLNEAQTPYTYEGKGTLYTYTVVHQGARGWAAPYMLGYVDLVEGVRIFTHLTGCAPEQLTIGMPLSVVKVPPTLLDDGTEVVVYKFEPSHATS